MWCILSTGWCADDYSHWHLGSEVQILFLPFWLITFALLGFSEVLLSINNKLHIVMFCLFCMFQYQLFTFETSVMPRIGPLFELAWFSLVLPLGHIHILLPKYATRGKIYPCFCFLYSICSLNVLQFSVNLSNISSFTAFWMSSYIRRCFGVYLVGFLWVLNLALQCCWF